MKNEEMLVLLKRAEEAIGKYAIAIDNILYKYGSSNEELLEIRQLQSDLEEAIEELRPTSKISEGLAAFRDSLPIP